MRFKSALLKELDTPIFTGQPQDRDLKGFEFKRAITHGCIVTQQFDGKFVPEELVLPNNPDYYAIGREENLI